MDWLAVLLAFVLGIVHYFSETVHINFPYFKKYLASFAAGVSVAYLLIQLIPEVTLRLNVFRNKIPYLFILIGFVIFYIIEKYIYQHTQKHNIIRRVKELHAVSLFVYHVLVGVLLVFFVRINPSSALLFFIPLFFNLSVNNLSLHNIHHSIKENPVLIWLESVSTLIGVIIAFLVPIPNYVILGFASFIAGSLLFIVVRDSIPKGREGNSLFFVLGSAVLILILYLGGVL